MSDGIIRTSKKRLDPMKRLIRATCFLSLVLFSGSVFAQDRIAVATLNGETIWLEEVMRAVEGLPQEYRQAPMDTYFDQLVAEVIDTRLAAAAGYESNLDKDKAVAQAMKMAADRILAEAFLSATINSQITDEAIMSAYDAFVADTASREQVTASHILVETEEAAQEIIAKLNDGGDFATLAKENSTGPSGPNGGALGTFGRGQMVPAFETAAFAMPVGSFSAEPVQTQFGWHVISVSERSLQPAPEMEAMRAQLSNNLSRQHLGRLLETLRADAVIDLRSFEDIRKDAQAAQQAQ
jgi:peptidyl-prolyl cis-trans isomerase C